jgi:D-3-phosphoglycerate dehydrogenase
MKILTIGDIVVSCSLLNEAAKSLLKNEKDIVVNVEWPCENRQEFQRRTFNIEKNGPNAEKAPKEAYKEIEDADILITHFCPVSKDLIDAGKKLSLIGTCRGGMEHIDVGAATKRNIPVIHCIRNAEATSDFAIGLMFAETRNIARGHAAIKQGQWRKDYVNSAYTTSMCEMTLGIVGLGHIGKLVAKKALGIGMKVIAYDPYISQDVMDNLGIKVKKISREELFRISDIISLHMRLTPETENSINEKLLCLMKPTAYLINTSRAGVLDKKAFLDAAQNKKIGGAALDVFWEEPLSEDDPLLTLDNVTLTPHTAGNVVDALPKSPLLLVRTIQAFWDAGKSDMVVNFGEIIPIRYQ